MPVVTGSVTAVFSGILLVIAQIKPSGSTRFLDFNAEGSIIYYHGDRSATVKTAEQFCKSLGGRLPVSIDELNRFALNNPAYKVDDFWLGPVKSIGSIYMWPNGVHLNNYHFNYKKWEPAPLSCEYMCCAITGKVITSPSSLTIEQKFIVKPFEEVPCHVSRKALCVITSTPGNTVKTVNESLKEFHSGYKGIVKKVSSFDSDRKKLKIAFDSLKKDLDENKNLWNQLDNPDIILDDDEVTTTAINNEKQSDDINNEYYFTNNITKNKFFFNLTWANLEDAKKLCHSIKGTLPMIKNNFDVDFLKNIAGTFRSIWLNSIQTSKSPKQTYTWADGSKIETNFRPNFPNCKTDCCSLALYSVPSGDSLIDLDCNSQAMVFCDTTKKVNDENDDDKTSNLNKKIDKLKKHLLVQKKVISELVKSFNKFISNAPATGSLFG